MRFVIDSAEWRFDGQSASEVAEAIERLLDRLDVAAERGEGAAYSGDLEANPVYKEYSLWALFVPEHEFELPRYVLERLSVALSRMARWDADDDWPTLFDVETDGTTSCRPDIAWAHSRARAGHHVACLTLRDGAGKTTVRVGGQSQDIWFINNERGHREFFRFAVRAECRKWADFGPLAPSAWPGIHHFDGVWDRVLDMSEFRAWRDEVMRHLDILDEHGARAFGTGACGFDGCTCKTGGGRRHSDKQIQDALPLNISPESPTTMEKSLCVRQRTADGPPRLVFEWHSKTRRYSGRLHVHPPLVADPHRILLGIVAEHLDT